MENLEFKGTKAPWAWQKFGDATYLTAQHGRREIIIGSINDVPAMNVNGLLERVNPEHPNAKIIEAAPDLLEALQNTLNTLLALGAKEDWVEVIEARKAIEKALK